MKQFPQRIATAIFAASLALTVVGCASTPSHESAGEYIDDAAITTKVKAAIFNEPTLKATEINVETYKGAVQLSGFVAQPQDAARAADIARGVKGVATVKNDIRVK
jgi:osmotically-inducible protein OsmY